MTPLPFDAWDDIASTGTYEQCFEALSEVVRRLDAGELGLDDSVRCYEVGAHLARRCDALLRDAELRISTLGNLEDNAAQGVALGSWLDDPDDA